MLQSWKKQGASKIVDFAELFQDRLSITTWVVAIHVVRKRDTSRALLRTHLEPRFGLANGRCARSRLSTAGRIALTTRPVHADS